MWQEIPRFDQTHHSFNEAGDMHPGSSAADPDAGFTSIYLFLILILKRPFVFIWRTHLQQLTSFKLLKQTQMEKTLFLTCKVRLVPIFSVWLRGGLSLRPDVTSGPDEAVEREVGTSLTRCWCAGVRERVVSGGGVGLRLQEPRQTGLGWAPCHLFNRARQPQLSVLALSPFPAVRRLGVDSVRDRTIFPSS